MLWNKNSAAHNLTKCVGGKKKEKKGYSLQGILLTGFKSSFNSISLQEKLIIFFESHSTDMHHISSAIIVLPPALSYGRIVWEKPRGK